MKIVLAPQSFKGSFTGKEVCKSIAKAILKKYPHAEIIQQPVGDGGDGTLGILVDSKDGEYQESTVLDAQQQEKVIRWGYFPDENAAYIESAAICGITGLSKKDPLTATSYGIGQCIKQVLDKDIQHIIIGLGGSATNDGGTGLLAALGVQFLDKQGISLPLGGGSLVNLYSIDASGMDTRLSHCVIEVACDVDNPLIGPEGATMVYSAQKGATPGDQEILEKGIAQFASLSPKSIDSLPYGGAAGGIAAGLYGFLGAHLLPGADLVLDSLSFDRLIQGADLVITGEGRMDRQTIYNKVPIVVAKRAKKQDISVIAIVGSIGEGYEEVLTHGIDAVYNISEMEIIPFGDYL